MNSSHDYVNFDDTIAEYNKIINEYRNENKQLRELLGNTRAFLAIHVWDNERSCCFSCGEKDYSVTADDCKEAPDYELAKKIDEVLNEQTPTP